MKKILSQYSFAPESGLIYFTGLSGLSLENFLLITNVSVNKIIYNFADPTAGGFVSGINNNLNNCLYLDYVTSGVMSSGDKLQIFYDINVERTDRASGYWTGAITGSGTSTGLYSPVVPQSFTSIGGRAVDIDSGFYPNYGRNDDVIANFEKNGGGLLSYQADLDYQIDSVTNFEAGYAGISNYATGVVTGTNASGVGLTIVSGNSNRISLRGQNLGDTALLVKYGAGCNEQSFSFILYPGTSIMDGRGEKLSDDKYKGDISVNVRPSGATGYFIFWEGV